MTVEQQRHPLFSERPLEKAAWQQHRPHGKTGGIRLAERHIAEICLEENSLGECARDDRIEKRILGQILECIRILVTKDFLRGRQAVAVPSHCTFRLYADSDIGKIHTGVVGSLIEILNIGVASAFLGHSDHPP